jgi:hypothetical protein
VAPTSSPQPALSAGSSKEIENSDLGGAVEVAHMRRNTLLALILLLAAIAIAGTLGVLQIYGLGSG